MRIIQAPNNETKIKELMCPCVYLIGPKQDWHVEFMKSVKYIITTYLPSEEMSEELLIWNHRRLAMADFVLARLDERFAPLSYLEIMHAQKDVVISVPKNVDPNVVSYIKMFKPSAMIVECGDADVGGYFASIVNKYCVERIKI